MTDNTHTDDEDPTKSSGELEEIVSQKLSEYSLHMREIHAGGCSYEDDDQTCNCGHSWDFNQYPRFMKALVTSLHLWHTTQTTKLQAEARIDELKRVDLLAVWDDPRLNGYLEARFIELAQLEREHKIGEDGE